MALLLCSTGCRATLPGPEVAAVPTPVSTPYTDTLRCLGRLFDFYYGRDQFRLTIAVEPAIEDPLLEQRILDYFEAQSALEQAKSIRELLRGYGERVALQGPWDAMIDARLEQLGQRHALKWRQGNRARAYLAVYTNLPLPPLK
jgi:hypothetical protein